MADGCFICLHCAARDMSLSFLVRLEISGAGALVPTQLSGEERGGSFLPLMYTSEGKEPFQLKGRESFQSKDIPEVT